MVKIKLVKFGDRDRGVSPVIAVILMVAITVILAAVLGTFVLGMGSDLQNSAPAVSIAVVSQHTEAFDATTEHPSSGAQLFDMDHQGGDTVSGEDLRIEIRHHSNASMIDAWESGAWENGVTTDDLNGESSLASNSTFSNGDQLTIWQNQSNTYQSDTRYDVVLIHTESDQRIATQTVRIR